MVPMEHTPFIPNPTHPSPLTPKKLKFAWCRSGALCTTPDGSDRGNGKTCKKRNVRTSVSAGEIKEGSAVTFVNPNCLWNQRSEQRDATC